MKVLSHIKTLFKSYFDKISNERVRNNLLQAIPFWIASLLTGLVAVFYAKFFTYAEQGTRFILQQHHYWLFLLTPVCFVIAWWVVVQFAKYARGSGIPQVMASIELSTPKYAHKVKKMLSIKVIIVKIISSLVFALGGGVIGREGPTIQVEGSIFRQINQWLPSWWPKVSKRNMVMTGAAAGLAAAFNTPLGGIVFAVEELTKTHISYFKTALFTAIIISGLTAQGLLGPYLYLGYPKISNPSSSIFLGVILVAVIAGLAGSGMSKIMLILFKWKSTFRFRYQHLLYVAGCAIIIALTAIFLDDKVLGSGKDLMAHSLFTADKYSPWYLPIMRIGGPILSFTTGAAGGVFAPSLSAGASIGSLLSGWFHMSDVNSNLLILAGMVAFLTGVTRTPFTSAILVLEMTDRHNLIFHLMLAGMVASVVSMLIDKHSFYDHLKVQYIHEVQHDDDGPAPVITDEEDPAPAEEKEITE
jgi:H+/Cl- antiporter ClcA